MAGESGVFFIGELFRADRHGAHSLSFVRVFFVRIDFTQLHFRTAHFRLLYADVGIDGGGDVSSAESG